MMKIVLAILLPPLAVLICGKPIQFFFNILFCIIGLWIGGIVHAMWIVSQQNTDRRHKEMMAMMEKTRS